MKIYVKFDDYYGKKLPLLSRLDGNAYATMRGTGDPKKGEPA